MLSVPPRWISSTSKRDLPSPRARQSISSGHDTPFTDTHVDPVPTVHGDESSDKKSDLKNNRSSSGDDIKSSSLDKGTGQLVDRSI